jgi:hypothetical protein
LVGHHRRRESDLRIFLRVSICAQGSAFYALQSCINHDNEPNCSCQKDVVERDGASVITTLRPVRANEELTISYVGDVSCYSASDVRCMLAEYGIPV